MDAMNSRSLCALAALPVAAAVLASCSSSGEPTGHTGTSGAPATPTSSAASTSSSAAASTSAAPAGDGATQLAAVLKAGVSKIRFAHLTLNLGVATEKITGAGDEQVVNGKVKALQITENLPGNQQIRIVYVGGKTYAKLPTSLTKSKKPYTLISPTSSNATIRSLAQSVNSSLQSASVQSAAVFVDAASSVKRVGSATIGGVPTTHYAVVVSAAKLPASLPGKSSLATAGITSIPVELYVDGDGRPVQVTENLTVAGKRTTTNATISRYNQPVTISAPPASQVATG